MARIVAVTGWSGSGKTTLLVAAIRKLVERGERVAAVKHTHHPLNFERRGDTERLREAGADPVILAGDGEAVIFAAEGERAVRFVALADLLNGIDVDLVVLEGFKTSTELPHLDLSSGTAPTADDLIRLLDRI